MTVKGKKYYVKGGKLDLSEKEITDIAEIKGLDNLTNLQELDLSFNMITEIKGLEKLKDLKKLDLSMNPIRPDERHLEFESAQDVVKYCQGTRKEKGEDEMEDEMDEATFESAFDAWRHERDLERYFDINLHASDFDIDEDWEMYKLDEGISIGLFIFMEDIFREELRGNKLSQHELIERINEWLRPYLTRG